MMNLPTSAAAFILSLNNRCGSQHQAGCDCVHAKKHIQALSQYITVSSMKNVTASVGRVRQNAYGFPNGDCNWTPWLKRLGCRCLLDLWTISYAYRIIPLCKHAGLACILKYEHEQWKIRFEIKIAPLHDRDIFFGTFFTRGVVFWFILSILIVSCRNRFGQSDESAPREASPFDAR
jgi:hypothetical protein